MRLRHYSFIIILFSFFSLNSISLGLEDCQSAFKPQFSLRANKKKWVSPYAQELYFFVYKQIPLLESYGFSKKEIKSYIKLFENTIDRLEASSNPHIQSRLDLLNPVLSSAVQNFPKITSFIANHKESMSSLDTKAVLNIMLSTFSKHVLSYLTHPHTEKLDWPRINEILKQIAEFKNHPKAFSLYKILRVVKQKYSLTEYINCK